MLSLVFSRFPRGRFLLWGWVVITLSLAGCRTFERDGRPVLQAPVKEAVKTVAVEPVEKATPELPAARGRTGTPTNRPPVEAGPYRIHAGDILHIQVTGEEEFSKDFKVSSDGMVLLPLLGRTRVEGMTVPIVEKALTAALAKDYLVNPEVFVQVRSSVVRRVILFGEVKSPGVYELPVGDRFTLLQLIAKAGGFTDVAVPERVRIVRAADGDERTIKVNVADLLRGRGQDADIELQPNDVITVPQSVF